MGEVVEFRTSGSSGVPKVICKTVESLAADAAMLAAHFGATWFAAPEQLVVLATVSREHMYGCLWLDYLMPAVGQPAVRQIQSPEEFLAAQQALGDRRLMLITTPSFLSELLKHPLAVRIKPTLMAVTTSGSLLSAELSRQAKAVFGVAPTEIYGSTETGSVAWRRQDEGDLWTLFEGVEATSVPAGVEIHSAFCPDGRWVLSDGVVFEAQTPQRFRLLGRQDRRVKILEQWVLLPEVEAALVAHPWIEAAAAMPSLGPVARIWALAVPSSAGRQAIARLGYARAIRQLRSDLAAAGLAELALPRRIRFVPELPYNARGKLTQEALCQEAAIAWQQPIFEGLVKAPDRLEAEVIFPADHAFFTGHFPGFAVLPGVGQLILIRAWIGRFFGVWVDGQVTQLKFQQLIRPVQTLHVEVIREAADCFAFTIDRDKARCSSGKLRVAPHQQEGGLCS